MSAAPIVAWFSSVSAAWLRALLTASLKGSLILAGVYLATRLLRASHPSLRHLLWSGAIASHAFILLLTLCSPPLLPARPIGPAVPRTALATVDSLLRPTGGLSVPVPPLTPSPDPAATRAPWSLALLVVWLAGVALSLAPVVVGCARARRLVASGADRPEGEAALHHRLRTVLAELGLARPVRVVRSPAVRAPCAVGVLHPTLVLPAGADNWPAQRLRAVLLHELGHVRRRDCLSQVAARCICAVFWFVPCAWFAYQQQYAEQEKACDAGVVGGGVRPADYVSCLLHFARQRSMPVAARGVGLYSPRLRRRLLEDRVHHIVRARTPAAPRWPAFTVAVLLLGALVLLSGARWKDAPTNAQAYRRFVGTWVNSADPGTLAQSQITVIRPDHFGEDWLSPDSTRPAGRWSISVRKTWVDERGNTYCQFLLEYTEGLRFCGEALMRVDRNARVWECNSRKADPSGATARWMEEIDPTLRNYWIYYRKE